MIEKRWNFRRVDPEAVRDLTLGLGLPEAIARVLAARGFASPRDAAEFLEADIERLANPFLMRDMEAAVERLKRAKASRETVMVQGDRDADGVTATAILAEMLEISRIRHSWRVPRPEDGYGFSLPAVDEAAGRGATLIITVDCGIRDHAAVEAAAAKGIDTIVLDHHEPGETLPPAVAVVDPKRADCPYPFRDLAGCGVAFKFCQAYLLSEDPYFEREVVTFDLETTGVGKRDEIVEIGAIKSRFGVETGRFHTLVKPSKPMPLEATEVNGITDEMLRDAPPIEEALARFLDFAGEDSILAAHNASFDIGFVTRWAKWSLGRKVRNPSMDTLSEARRYFPGRSHALGNLADDLGITLEGAHRAMADVEATFHLLKRIVSRRNPKVQAFLKRVLDLVSIGTTADVVPLVGENRVLVTLGMKRIGETARPGLNEIVSKRVRSRKPTSKDVSWTIGPLLNAPGRMGRADLAVKLLLSRKRKEAAALASEIFALNEERKERVRVNEEIVVRELESSFDPERDRVCFALVEGMTRGVTGIVANRLVHSLGRPVAILIDDGDDISGTIRSIDGLDITSVLTDLSSCLTRYGGHAGAAGLALKRERVEEFRVRLEEAVVSKVRPEDLIPRIEIDAEIRPSEVSNGNFLDGLARLEPMGFGNERPVFAVRSAVLSSRSSFGKGHVRLTLERNGEKLSGIVGWNTSLDSVPPEGAVVDVAFTAEEDPYRGGGRVQCILEEIRESPD